MDAAPLAVHNSLGSSQASVSLPVIVFGHIALLGFLGVGLAVLRPSSCSGASDGTASVTALVAAVVLSLIVIFFSARIG